MDNDLPPIDVMLAQVEACIEAHAAQAITNAMNQVAGEGDFLVLGALGVDARKKILEVFITRCQKMLSEGD